MLKPEFPNQRSEEKKENEEMKENEKKDSQSKIRRK